MRLAILCLFAILCASCIRQVQAPPGPRGEIHVAAAANLNGVLQELNKTFEKTTNVHVVPSFGATAQLEQQLESGAPFDVFLSADTSHVDELIRKGLSAQTSRGIYAKGQLVVYAPDRPNIHSLQDLATPKALEIFVAKPELAPYGAAAVEAMKSAGIWQKLESHTKYAPNIASAKQYADTGNCDAAFTAYSLVFQQNRNFFVVDSKLYQPISQAMCILKSTKNLDLAQLYTSFLVSFDARNTWKTFGYGRP